MRHIKTKFTAIKSNPKQSRKLLNMSFTGICFYLCKIVHLNDLSLLFFFLKVLCSFSPVLIIYTYSQLFRCLLNIFVCYYFHLIWGLFNVVIFFSLLTYHISLILSLKLQRNLCSCRDSVLLLFMLSSL